jgi:hypothetical protein
MTIAHLRSHFSIQHIWSAAHFARVAGRIEAGHQSASASDAFFRHRAYVTTAIATAVAALEASVNELFSDAADDNSLAISSLGADTISLFAEMWRLGIPRTARYPILDKFQIALSLAKRSPMDPGSSPYQEVATVVAVRNALIHYEPVWMRAGVAETPLGEEHRLEKLLRGRFTLNPLAGPGNPYFPDKCLSYGCAAWAVTHTIAFTDAAFGRLGLTPRYEHIRAQLSTIGDP